VIAAKRFALYNVQRQPAFTDQPSAPQFQLEPVPAGHSIELIGACIADDQRQQMEKLATEGQWERVNQRAAQFRPDSHILAHFPSAGAGCGGGFKYKGAHRPAVALSPRGIAASRGVRLPLRTFCNAKQAW